MRKTTTYARKRVHAIKTVYDLKLAKARHITATEVAMARCSPYEGNPLFEARPILLRVHNALDGFVLGTIPDKDTTQYDVLAGAIGEAEIRIIEMGGEESQEMQTLFEAGDALLRAKERWKRIGKWGFDGVGLKYIKEALGYYEDILLASSPQQMEDAWNASKQLLKRMKTDESMQRRMAERIKKAVAA